MVCFLCLFAASFLRKCLSHCTRSGSLLSKRDSICVPQEGSLVNPTRLQLHARFVFLPAPTHVAFRLFFGIFIQICINQIDLLLSCSYVQGFLLARDRKPFRPFLVKREIKERRLGFLWIIWRQGKVQPGHRRPWDCELSTWVCTRLSLGDWPPASTFSAHLLWICHLPHGCPVPRTFRLHVALAYGSRRDFHSVPAGVSLHPYPRNLTSLPQLLNLTLHSLVRESDLLDWMMDGFSSVQLLTHQVRW